MPIILEKDYESTIFDEKQNMPVSKTNPSIPGKNWRESSHYTCGENGFKMVRYEEYIHILLFTVYYILQPCRKSPTSLLRLQLEFYPEQSSYQRPGSFPAPRDAHDSPCDENYLAPDVSGHQGCPKM